MRFVRKLFIYVFFCLVPLLCCLIALPFVLSTQTGKNALLHLVEKYTKKSIEIDSLSVGWLTGVHAEKLCVTNASGKKLFQCSSLYIHKPLLQWIYTWNSFGVIEIQSPSVHVYTHPEEARPETQEKSPHKEKSHVQEPRSEKKVSFPLLQGKVLVDDASVTVSNTDSVIGSITNGSVDLSLDLEDGSQGKIAAKLIDGHNSTPLSFDFTLNNCTGSLENCMATFSVNIEQLPVDCIKAIASVIDPTTSDIIEESFGNSLTYKMEGSFENKQLHFSHHLTSNNICSDVDISVAKNICTINQGTLVHGTITPKLQKTVCSSMPDMVLKNPVPFVIQNHKPLQFDLLQYVFTAPALVTFTPQTPFLFSCKNEEPLSLSCDATLSTEENNTSIEVKVNSLDSAKALFETNVQKREIGYKANASLQLSGIWPKIIEKTFLTPMVSTIGETLSADVRVEATVLDTEHVNIAGSSVVSSPLLHHSLLCTSDLHSATIESSATFPSHEFISKCNTSIRVQDLFKKKFSASVEGTLLFKDILGQMSFSFPLLVDLSKETLSISPRLAQGEQASISGDIFVKNFNQQPTIKGSFECQATLTPKYLQSLQQFFKKENDFSLLYPVTLQAKIPQVEFVVPEKTDAKSLFSSLKLQAHLFISPIQLQHNSEKLGAISALEGTLEIDGSADRVHVSLSPKKTIESVSIEAQASVHDLFKNDVFDIQQASVDSSFAVNSFPTKLMEIACPKKGIVFEEAVGKESSIHGAFSSTHMQAGVVKLDVIADRASLHVDGAIQNGILTLNTPVSASLVLTRRAGELLLKDIHPLLATAMHSEKPITATIDAQGVAIPLSTFSWQQLTLPQVTVDVGRILVKNTGTMKVLLALLRQGKAANSDEVHMWVTPMYINVNHGLVTCKRSDALVADELHFITWGTVDLVRDNMNMTLAVPPTTLSKIGLQILTAHPERGLQIPIRGPTSNPKIETARATAKLAGAGAMSVGGDQKIKLLGGLLQAAASIGEEDQPIPPPTTNPFPWDRSQT